MSKTVEQYLKEVDYSFPDYIPKQESVAFINFIKLLEGGETENKSPVVHLKVLDNMFTLKKRQAIMCHRGFAKSSLIEYMILYIAVFGKLPGFGEITLGLYVADSAEGGCKTLRKNLEFKYNFSSFLQAHIPKIKFTDSRLEFYSKSGNVFSVYLYGGQQNIRGVRANGKRPQIAWLDDLLSDKDAQSPTVLADVENNISKAISKALHPAKHKIIYVGTPFNQQDPLHRRVESGKWDVSVYPICEKFPCSKEEFKGSWEDRFTYDYVMDMYEEAKSIGALDGFYQELMLQIKSDEDRLLTDDEIIHIDIPKRRRRDMNYYITTDFATSEKEGADFSVISVWGINRQKKRILVDGVCKRQLMDKNIDDLFRLANKYRPYQVSIEVTGQQGGFISWINQKMVEHQVYFNIKEVRPKKNKISRFMEILPEFKLRNILFNENLDKEFLDEVDNELSNITVKGIKSSHDDVIDTVNCLVDLDIIYPTESLLDSYEAVSYDVDFSTKGNDPDLDNLLEGE